jgi:hypothetical protein
MKNGLPQPALMRHQFWRFRWSLLIMSHAQPGSIDYYQWKPDCPFKFYIIVLISIYQYRVINLSFIYITIFLFEIFEIIILQGNISIMYIIYIPPEEEICIQAFGEESGNPL